MITRQGRSLAHPGRAVPARFGTVGRALAAVRRIAVAPFVIVGTLACGSGSAQTLSTAAYKDYMLQCAGCHRYDGNGVAQRGVPSFRNSIGLLASLPAGRDYMIRVPGAAQSQLSNAELANVLNWAVMTYSPEQAGPDFRPFTANEIGAARPYRFDDVTTVRKALASTLAEQGHTLAPYTFGNNPEQ
ncbi:cytochrome C [Allopusillimonas ginsengisoli]|uniref:cytochrome C n=1 Tax=Allopusillimonas ginsengisoli TaxID=453575 RepID=UPI001021ADAD|nr:cytochrome C [Allopusillimonas ginsengisoli]TEA76893.1 cytochrome C [Allopusillimonas ginsengisoli]